MFEQFVMPSKKKLQADRHTADVEKGFSMQNLICTSQRIRLTTGNQDMVFRVQMEAPREVKSQSELMMKWQINGGKGKEDVIDRREEEQTLWVVG